jgi:uncharacterized membrane protein
MEPIHEQPQKYDVVMMTFEGPDTAGRVLKRLRGDEAFTGSEIEAEAWLARDADGTVHVREKGSAGMGAAFGAVTAGVVGLMGGPVILLLMVAAGGAVGGVLGHYAGQALPTDDLKKAAETLPPGSSAYLAVVDAAHAAGVAEAARAEGATVVDIPVETELSSMVREAITHSVRRV